MIHNAPLSTTILKNKCPTKVPYMYALLTVLTNMKILEHRKVSTSKIHIYKWLPTPITEQLAEQVLKECNKYVSQYKITQNIPNSLGKIRVDIGIYKDSICDILGYRSHRDGDTKLVPDRIVVSSIRKKKSNDFICYKKENVTVLSNDKPKSYFIALTTDQFTRYSTVEEAEKLINQSCLDKIAIYKVVEVLTKEKSIKINKIIY